MTKEFEIEQLRKAKDIMINMASIYTVEYRDYIKIASDIQEQIEILERV